MAFNMGICLHTNTEWGCSPLCHCQLVAGHLSIMQSSEMQPGSRIFQLLCTPYMEGLARANTLHTQGIAVSGVYALDRVTDADIVTETPRYGDNGCQLYLESVSRLLQNEYLPQHGTSPGEESQDLLSEILKRVVKPFPVPASSTTLDASSTTTAPESAARLHSSSGTLASSASLIATGVGSASLVSHNITGLQFTRGKLHKMVINIPMHPGEAACLVRCWSQAPDARKGEDNKRMIHPMYELAQLLAITMLEAPTTRPSVSTVVDFRTPAVISPIMSEKQSKMEMVEAMWRLGEQANRDAMLYLLKNVYFKKTCFRTLWWRKCWQFFFSYRAHGWHSASLLWADTFKEL